MNRLPIFLFTALSVFSLSIEEKLSLCEQTHPEISETLQEQNKQLIDLKSQISTLCQEAESHHEDEEAIKAIAVKVGELRAHLFKLENSFAKSYSDSVNSDEDGMTFFDKDEITLQQLLNEYGPQDMIYLCPQELGSLKIHFHN